VNSPADVAWEGMAMNIRILEVDPIHRRIVLGVVDIPEGQERPAEPSKVHTEDEVVEIPAEVMDDEDA
jgi:small subunit ribosomal protein S1